MVSTVGILLYQKCKISLYVIIHRTRVSLSHYHLKAKCCLKNTTTLRKSKAMILQVVWHPTEDILASASYDNTVKLFKEDKSDCDWICVATLQSHDSTVWGLSFDKTGNRLATCSDDTTVKIWKEYKPNNVEGIPTKDDEQTWKCVCTLSGYHTRTVYDVSWCHLTGYIATACGDDIIRVFKEEQNSDPTCPTFALVNSAERSHSEDVNSVVWNPAVAGLLASCSDDGEIKLWNFKE